MDRFANTFEKISEEDAAELLWLEFGDTQTFCVTPAISSQVNLNDCVHAPSFQGKAFLFALCYCAAQRWPNGLRKNHLVSCQNSRLLSFPVFLVKIKARM